MQRTGRIPKILITSKSVHHRFMTRHRAVSVFRLAIFRNGSSGPRPSIRLTLISSLPRTWSRTPRLASARPLKRKLTFCKQLLIRGELTHRDWVNGFKSRLYFFIISHEGTRFYFNLFDIISFQCLKLKTFLNLLMMIIYGPSDATY